MSNVLFVASEIFPYAKSGGLADVAHSLPDALRKNGEVYTVMPLYRIVNRDKFGIVYAGLTFDVWLNGTRHQVDVFTRTDNKYELFLYNPVLCDRDGMYYDSFGDFGDNALRFGIFSYASIEVMLHMQLQIDAIHINDWQSALVALLAKSRYYLPQKIVYTIHNLAYQGIFPKSAVDELQISWKECFKPDRLEYFDHINLMKAGIFYSDYVTTVSPTYAHEIQTPTFGHTLETMLQNNSYKLRGILNGISFEVFNPDEDKLIFEQYSAKSYKGKLANKLRVMENLGFEGKDKPLFCFIGRFTAQKGIDLLVESLHLLKDFELNIAILGSGEKYYDNLFERLKGRYKNVHITIGYNEAYAQQLYAASDFLIMPSRFEPCGLNQMITMRYGGLPLVAKTGGLRDTVEDFTDVDMENLKNHHGIGITYQEHNLFWFMHAMSKAISLYSNKEKFLKISKHNMAVDNSWKNSAIEYEKLYQ